MARQKAKLIRDFTNNTSLRQFLEKMEVKNSELMIISKIDFEKILKKNLQDKWLAKPGSKKILQKGVTKYKKTTKGKAAQRKATKKYRTKGK